MSADSHVQLGDGQIESAPALAAYFAAIVECLGPRDVIFESDTFCAAGSGYYAEAIGMLFPPVGQARNDAPADPEMTSGNAAQD
jgi:hypothetical protein